MQQTLPMTFTEYLDQEWRPALGCTEPASIALCAARAARLLDSPVSSVRLRCDPRIYKNCYAVGIPHSGHKVGIRWALAIGCQLPDPDAGLQCFRQITPEVIERAGRLLDRSAVAVAVDGERQQLHVEVTLQAEDGSSARALIRENHTHLVLLERDGEPRPLPRGQGPSGAAGDSDARASLAERSLEDLLDLSRQLTDEDRRRLREGARHNIAMAWHGLSLFPERFVNMAGRDPLTRISRLVCAGVYARMWGEDLVVMSLAGSGNKGIVSSVPITLWGQELGLSQRLMDEALALACLVTSGTTHHLGTLSAVCGCSNAAGIGLACGLVLLEGGGPAELSLAVNNMVGNVTGMICDGAKIGCALKTMTSVDAAFRSSSLALSGIGIPLSDGIVGGSGMQSLRNLGRIATCGMTSMDREILRIMQQKLAEQAGEVP